MRRSLRWVIAAVVGIGVLGGVGTFTLLAQASAPTITAAPAFTATQLAAYAGNDWVENGGDIETDRYS